MKKNNRNERFEMKISQADKELLRQKADEMGLTMADYLAKCIHEEPMVKLVVKQDIQRVKYELSMIGTNLNQIAHALNGEYYHFPEDAAKIEDALEELKRVLTKVRDTFGACADSALSITTDCNIMTPVFGNWRSKRFSL